MLLEALVLFSAKKYPPKHFGIGMKTLYLRSTCVTYREEPDCVLRSTLSMEARSKLRRKGGRYVHKCTLPTIMHYVEDGGEGGGEGRERIKEGWRAGERNSNRKREKMERVR